MRIPLTVDIVRNFIQRLKLSGVIDCIEEKEGKTYIKTDNILNARKGLKIAIHGIDYVIDSVIHSTEQIVIDDVSLGLFGGLEWQIQNPYFYNGTPYAVNNELSKIDSNNKVPFVYLYEIFKERRTSIDSGWVKESDLSLHILDYANMRDWSTKDHYTEVIIGINKLVNFIIDELNSSLSFYQFEETYELVNHVKWGQFSNFRGHTNSVFNEHLSGIELNFTLRIREQCINRLGKKFCMNSFLNPMNTYLKPTSFYNYSRM